MAQPDLDSGNQPGLVLTEPNFGGGNWHRPVLWAQTRTEHDFLIRTSNLAFNICISIISMRETSGIQYAIFKHF